FNSDNWGLMRLPAATDNVVISAAGSINTSNGQAITVTSLDLRAGELAIANGLTVASGDGQAPSWLQIRDHAVLELNAALSVQHLVVKCGTLKGPGPTAVSQTLHLGGSVTFHGGNVTLLSSAQAYWMCGTVTSEDGASF